MRIEKFNNGWDEIVTTKIRTTGPNKQFQTASHWVKFTTNRPQMNTKGRNHCERCKAKWSESDPDLMTYFVMTDKGNKVVCEPCYRDLFPLL